jgi:hypothetical protein
MAILPWYFIKENGKEQLVKQGRPQHSLLLWQFQVTLANSKYVTENYCASARSESLITRHTSATILV